MKNLLYILIFTAGNAIGQDIHFSQIFHAPFNQSPALTGMFDGDWRVHANHRTQWNSVSPGVPFRTFGFFVDGKDPFGNGIHPGLAIYQDKTGDSRFSTLMFNLHASKGKWLDEEQHHYVQGGIMLGISQRTINYQYLSFDNQYNGSYYDPSLSHGEQFSRAGYAFLNASVGGAYHLNPGGRWSATGFLGIHNLTTPKQTFFNDKSIRLDRRLVVGGSGKYAISAKVSVNPLLQLMVQGKYHELLPGGLVNYYVSNETVQGLNLFAGALGRTRDAGVIVFGAEYENWRAAVSYDLNLSKLRPASNARGGMEIGVVYIFRKFRPVFREHEGCPTYI